MSSRSHRWLRGAALALLVAAGIWPRGAGSRHAGATTAADAMRGASDATMTASATRATRGLARATRSEPSQAHVASPAPRAALAAAGADELSLSN